MKAAVPLLVLGLGLLPSCTPDDSTAGGDPFPGEAGQSTAPAGETAASAPSTGEAPRFPQDDPGVFVPFGDRGIRRVRTGTHERVVAYVSRPLQEIYIRPGFRDRVQNLLNAHISVSTGHWRIHLPGDSSSEPLTPGVPEREFEELDLAAWDSTLDPSAGDFRVLTGAETTETLFLTCEPIVGRSDRFRSRGNGLRTISARGESVGREDFVRLVDIARLDPECVPLGDSLNFWGWVATGRSP